MCNQYSITTNQAAIIALFRVINRDVGNRRRFPGYSPTTRLRWFATTAASLRC
jgi:hypothetical protein